MARLTWTSRALALSERLELHKAPADIVRAADDAVQHFVWATDCRRQANVPYAARGDNYRPGWGAKADKAHYHGKKCYGIAQGWLDKHLLSLAAAPGESDNAG